MKSDIQGIPDMPPDVATVFDGYPPEIRERLLAVRHLIFSVAKEQSAGPLTETLKWGEPAYLTQSTKSGTTIRLGQVRRRHGAAVLFHCQTTLVAGFRDQFGDVFRFDGNRALLLKTDGALPKSPLAICLARALTYHRAKRRGSA